jgi:hypothetical protein
MRKALIGAALAGLAAASVAPLAQSSASATTTHRTTKLTAAVDGVSPSVQGTPRYYIKHVDPNFSVVGPTVKFFSAQAKSGSSTFNIKQIGTFPGDSANPTSTISVKIIPLALKFTDNVTLDPTATLPSCAGGGTAVNRTVNSGLFKNVNTNLGGPRQFLEAFRRSEYWFLAPKGPNSGNPNYSVRLAPTVLPKTTVSVSGPSVPEACGRGGNITISSYDNFLKTTLFPSYGANLKTTDLAFVVTSNAVLCQSSAASSCGILGYHSAFQRGGHTQTYGTSEFATDQRFKNGQGKVVITDTSIASHELGEWLDDPFVDNGTPAWGHIGQVSGCQNNLETGDPLTGTLFNVTTTTGTTSHVQDLAEFSWFYRGASIAFNHWFSFLGTFKVASVPCS